MAGAFHGVGEPEVVLNVGVSGPGVVLNAVRKIPNAPFDELATTIKHTAFKVTRSGELVGREAARRLGTAPAETAVFEDALFAARTAKAAGFHVVAIYDDNSAASWDEMSALADESIRDWEQAQ